MLSLKSGLLLGIFGAIAIAVGCSASGPTDGDVTFDKPATDPTAKDAGGASKKLEAPKGDGGASASSSSSGGDTQGDDDDSTIGDDDDATGSSSSGGLVATDAGVDAGPPAPETGDSCSVLDQKYTRMCGQCGKQEAICATNRAGELKVTDYGPCGGQAASAVCTAGDSMACGRCGTKVCGNTCAWGSCKNEGVCKAGVISHDPSGCPTPGTYRSRKCTDTCTAGNLTACAEPGITVPAPGDTVSEEWNLNASQVARRPDSCKKSTWLTTVPGFGIPLTNPTANNVTVQIWHSSPGGNAGVDTLIATYPKKPTTDDEWKACTTQPVDNCSQLPGPSGSTQDLCFADGGTGFAGVDNITVPANSTIWIYSFAWSTYSVGKFVLNVKTK